VYVETWNAFERLATRFSPAENLDLFHDTEARDHEFRTTVLDLRHPPALA
jgi:hypothetical protein